MENGKWKMRVANQHKHGKSTSKSGGDGGRGFWTKKKKKAMTDSLKLHFGIGSVSHVGLVAGGLN